MELEKRAVAHGGAEAGPLAARSGPLAHGPAQGVLVRRLPGHAGVLERPWFRGRLDAVELLGVFPEELVLELFGDAQSLELVVFAPEIAPGLVGAEHDAVVADAIRALNRLGVIEAVGGRWRIVLVWYREVMASLERRNLLTG